MALLRTLFILFGIAGIAGLVADVTTYDKNLARSDFARLKQGMAQHYANLDWQVDERGLDLADLSARTDNALIGSISRVQAWLAFKDFVAAFDDPHLHHEWGQAPEYANLVGTLSATDLECVATGFEHDGFDSALAYRNAPEFEALPEGNFPAGTIGDMAILRIAEFGENKYRGGCASDAMSDRALQLATRDLLDAEMDARLEALKETGATRLVIDVTDNGGGSEWASLLAARFGRGEMRRRAPRIAGPACDRAGIWQGIRDCDVYAPPQDAFEVMDGRGQWDGPILILANRNSASATEAFIAWLQDNDAARFAGERTLGAGCGYIDGGNAVQLEAIPMHVLIPNCTRYTMDGRNEMEGLAPDVEVDLAGTRADDFADLLDELLTETD